MKTIFALLATAMCLISTVISTPHSFEKRDLLSYRAAGAPADTFDIDVVSIGNGTTSITLFDHNVVIGTLVTYVNGTTELFDAKGKPVSDEEDLEKRGLGSALKFLKVFAKLISRFGSPVVKWGKCIGVTSAIHCSNKFLDCAIYGSIAPWDCIDGYWCLGKSVGKCRP